MEGLIIFNVLGTLDNILSRRLHPGYKHVDANFVTAVKTNFGMFELTEGLQNYPNIFEQVAEYELSDLSRKDVVLEFGGCIGAFAVRAAPLCKYLISVEPLFFNDLQKNVKLNNISNFAGIETALGPDNYESKINFAGKTRKISFMSFGKTLEFIDTFGYPTPNFLKIDCEGGEWSMKPEDFKMFWGVEGEFHTFDYAGKKRDPKIFLKMFEDFGYKCKYGWTENGQLMVSARRVE